MAQLDQADLRGWEMLHLTTADLRVAVLPGLGGTITSVRRLVDDAEVCWSRPQGVRARGLPGLGGTAEAQRDDQQLGGWQTLFPNAADAATLYGVEWPYDGEVRLTWLDWEFTGSSLILRGQLLRGPFELTKIISVRGSQITVGETVRNLGNDPLETIWASRLCLGGAALGPDTVLESGARVVRADPRTGQGAGYDDVLPWPRAHGGRGMVNLRQMPGPEAGESRIAYLMDFAHPYVELRRPSTDLHLRIEWEDDPFPFLWYELEAGGEVEHPWWGTGYMLALTPSSSWPARGLHDARRVADTALVLPPGTARTSSVTLTVGRFGDSRHPGVVPARTTSEG